MSIFQYQETKLRNRICPYYEYFQSRICQKNPNRQKEKKKEQLKCNLVENQYNEVLYTFAPNKSYGCLLNVEPSNLVFLKTYNTESDDVTKSFTDQSGRPSEIEKKVNLTLLINKQIWLTLQAQQRVIILWKQKQDDMSKNMDFCHSE